MNRRFVNSPRDHLITPLSLATDGIDVTLGASDLWLGNRTGTAGTATRA